MQKTPSIDWPRRTSPLSGVEDLLKQNPSTDAAPQEERVPVSLISDYTLNQLSFVNLGSGVGTFDFKLGSEVRLRSVGAASNKVVVSLDPDKTISLDVNTTNIAADIPLNKLQNVENVTPSNNQLLSYNTSTNKWVPKTIKSPIILPLHVLDITEDVNVFASSTKFLVMPVTSVLKYCIFSVYTLGSGGQTQVSLLMDGTEIATSNVWIANRVWQFTTTLDIPVVFGDRFAVKVTSARTGVKDKGLAVTLYFEPS